MPPEEVPGVCGSYATVCGTYARSLKKGARKGGSDCSFYTRVGWGASC